MSLPEHLLRRSQTITGAARSEAQQVAGALVVVELNPPAGFDRNVNFQVAFDPLGTAEASLNWVDALAVRIDTAGNAPAVGNFAPAASVRRIYAILVAAPWFSVNVSGGTAGNLAWRLLGQGNLAAIPYSPATGGSATQVQGVAADGAAVLGNPVLIAGQDGTNAQSLLTDTLGRPTLAPPVVTGTTTGQGVAPSPLPGVVWAHVGGRSRGDADNSHIVEVDIPADAYGNSAYFLNTMSHLGLYNGTSWDRQRRVVPTAYLASAARTGDPAVSARTNYNFRAVAIFLNVTSVGAPAGSITGRIQVQDPTSLNWVSVFSAATAVATTGERLYVLGQADWAAKIGAGTSGITEAFDGLLPGSTWRFFPDHANETDSIIYSVDVIEIP